MAISILNGLGDRELQGKDVIVRYMKLSTFMMLLSGRVFIPTLRHLQKDDANEGLLPTKVWPQYAVSMQGILVPFHEWLNDRSSPPKVVPKNNDPFDKYYLQMLAETWLKELAVRRCIWCWNNADEHSHALWKLYGQRGVAIQSRVERVKEALSAYATLRGLVSLVDYSLPRRFYTGHKINVAMKMLDKRFRPFPYLFKDAGYRYEQEVRFVFGVHQNLMIGKFGQPGILIEVDSDTLIEKFELSPEIPEDERRVIELFAEDIIRGQKAALEFPQDRATKLLMRFKTVEGGANSPFTTKDEPDGPFPDLDC